MTMATENAHADHSHDHDGAHGSFKSYMVGFVLSVVLTVIPFWLVMADVLDSRIGTLLIVFILGGVQMLVHIFYFLHVTAKAEEGWLAMSLIFTVVLVVIVMTGSSWVMLHLHENMMPAHEIIERLGQ